MNEKKRRKKWKYKKKNGLVMQKFEIGKHKLFD